MIKGSISVSHNTVLANETFARIYSPDADQKSNASFAHLSFSVRAEGGYHRCRFTVTDDANSLHEMFYNGLSRHVVVASLGGTICWEGMIYDLALRVNETDIRRTSAEVYNKIWVRYRITGATTINRSTVVESTTSQSKYGIREMVMSAGELETDAVALQMANKQLSLSYEARTSLDNAAFGVMRDAVQNKSSLTVTCIGYYDTLFWQCYNQTSDTGNLPASSVVSDIVAAKAQFVRAGVYSPNSTPVTVVYDTDRPAGAIVADIARLGDYNGNRWLIRMGANRTLYYCAAATPERS